MEYRHEIITFGDSIPVKCFVHELGHSARHWHNSMELLLVLSGSVHISIGSVNHELHADDMILVNCNESHELTAEHCVLAAIQIKLSMFDEKVVSAANLYFDCNSQTRPNDTGIRHVKRIIAQFVQAYALGGESRLLRAKSLSYALLSELITYFKVDRNEQEQNQSRYQYERITRIAGYINEHYAENITLQGLAEQEYLSVPYLSKFFMRMMGVNFTAYLNSLRLTHATAALTGTAQTIETIASSNGFPNTQAFVQLFKKKYGVLPSQYRKQHPPESAKEASYEVGNFNEYTILDSHEYLSRFVDYLKASEEAGNAKEDDALPVIPVHYSIDAANTGTRLRNSWRSFTTVGSAKELILQPVQQMLQQLQKDVGFTYVKFHGILSDDMHVVTRDASGKLHFSFVFVDQTLDFLRSIHLKPLIQLSFMPAALAAEPGHLIFDSTMINSPPKNLEEWRHLITVFTQHLLQRYGIKEVCSWPFTVWNEPDTPQSMFGFPSQEAFYQFYRVTWEAVKSCDPAIKVGTPSTYFDVTDAGIWLRNFTAWCASNACMPDCIFFHYYGTTVTQSVLEKTGQEITLRNMSLTRDENLLKKSIESLLSYTRTNYSPDTPVYMTEWNYSPSHRDLLGDTCFRSCYLVKNILENYDRLDAMGYWLLTDLFEERQIPNETFFGGLGLFTSEGIKKPAYYAFYLLAKLGDELVDQGDGYFLTRRGNDYQLMLYNYCHYSDLYAAGETFDMTDTQRYGQFENARKRDFEIRITGLPMGAWRVIEYTLNRQSGSSFDKWVEMGAQPLESPEEVELLQSLSLPMMSKYTATATERGLTLHALLEPLEVRLVLLNL